MTEGKGIHLGESSFKVLIDVIFSDLMLILHPGQNKAALGFVHYFRSEVQFNRGESFLFVTAGQQNTKHANMGPAK